MEDDMTGKVIDQEGSAESWTAVYWRYHNQCTYEADSLEEALGFLHSGEDNGDLSSHLILDPSGAAVMDKDAIFKSWCEWPDGDWHPKYTQARAKPQELTSTQKEIQS